MTRAVSLPVLDDAYLSDSPKEECGVVAVWNHPDAVHLGYLGLFSLQHRGQEAAGLAASSNGKINSQRGQGLVADVLTPERLELLDNYYNKDKSTHPQNHPQKRGVIGHTRYSTAGGSGLENIQPLVENMFDGPIAIAHNGNLINADIWKHELSKRGQIFHTSSDTEVMVHLLAHPDQRNSPDPTGAMLQNLQGAFSLVILFKDRIEAARDPWGFRPLVLGELPDGSPAIASETVALDVMGATFIREIEPGEIVTLSDDGISSRRYTPAHTPLARCVFEHVYFANPASTVFGQNVLVSRERFGAQLAIESPVDADFVMPMPDSGRSAANGYADQSGIPYREGIVPNRYVGRTFIKPTQEQRAAAVRLKLNVVSEIVKDKRVIIVDDSIVRGTTTREKMKQIRAAGASEIHVRISCPPIISPCFFGVDFATTDQLIAHNKSVEEIREYLGVDSLEFLSHEGMLGVMHDQESGYCSACFTGKYPIDPERPLACQVSAAY